MFKSILHKFEFLILGLFFFIVQTRNCGYTLKRLIYITSYHDLCCEKKLFDWVNDRTASLSSMFSNKKKRIERKMEKKRLED